MVSIGGWFPSYFSDLPGGMQDPWTSGIGVFDLTEFSWKDHYNASAATYEPPDVVREYYASNYKEPVWANDSLASTFSK